MCQKLNINHSIIHLKNKDLLHEFKRLIKFNEFPLGGLSQIAMFKLYEKAREKGIKVFNWRLWREMSILVLIKLFHLKKLEKIN